jgi:hypothetical protein
MWIEEPGIYSLWLCHSGYCLFDASGTRFAWFHLDHPWSGLLAQLAPTKRCQSGTGGGSSVQVGGENLNLKDPASLTLHEGQLGMPSPWGVFGYGLRVW